jgi:MFS family permease
MSPAAAVRAPGVPRTLALALLSRVPLSAIGLLLVLQVRHLGHSYTLAGACSGACALGMAIGAPVLGRIIDRAGQAAVLSATGAAVVAVTALFAVIPAGAPAPLFILVAALIGAMQPPVGSCVRVLWRRMLDGPGFSALVTLDASLQELAFLSGPLLLIGLASGIGSAAALVATATITGVVAALFALLPETRRPRPRAPGTPAASGCCWSSRRSWASRSARPSWASSRPPRTTARAGRPGSSSRSGASAASPAASRGRGRPPGATRRPRCRGCC